MKSCMDLRVRARVTGPNLYNDTQESVNETLRCADNTDL